MIQFHTILLLFFLSEISRNKEQLTELKRFKCFLDNLAPQVTMATNTGGGVVVAGGGGGGGGGKLLINILISTSSALYSFYPLQLS